MFREQSGMFPQGGYERRDSEWQAMALAGVTALAIVLLLAAGTALIWFVGRGPVESTALTAQEPRTPTPRAISFGNAAATPPSDEPDADAAGAVAAPTVAPATPALLNAPIEQSAGGAEGLLFEATRAADFAPLASGSWSTGDPGLINPGDQAIAERWQTLATVPAPSFAIEAEIRVSGVLETVCDQSFGIAGGSPDADKVFGAGVIFPCTGDSPLARLTDVTTWEDGYNADPVIADAAFEPDDAWHRYRFELRDGQLLLLVDGEEIVSDRADPGIAPTATDTETGLWSQGVGLEVRRLAVYALPAE